MEWPKRLVQRQGGECRVTESALPIITINIVLETACRFACENETQMPLGSHPYKNGVVLRPKTVKKFIQFGQESSLSAAQYSAAFLSLCHGLQVLPVH
jgi:hypothetical protein